MRRRQDRTCVRRVRKSVKAGMKRSGATTPGPRGSAAPRAQRRQPTQPVLDSPPDRHGRYGCPPALQPGVVAFQTLRPQLVLLDGGAGVVAPVAFRDLARLADACPRNRSANCIEALRTGDSSPRTTRSEEHTSELQS